MQKFKLEEVTTSAHKKEFSNLAKRLYRGNRQWVCPLDSDIEHIFDPLHNAQFAEGEAIRWIARDEAGKVVGRIAAFYNRSSAANEEQPTGGCGFFEAENNQELANLLFDTARDWLKERGMEAMDGPVNFGNRDQWWGLLVEGFEFQPLYANPYNLPYYKELFENYGFQVWFHQHTYIRRIKVGDLPETVYQRVKR